MRKQIFLVSLLDFFWGGLKPCNVENEVLLESTVFYRMVVMMVVLGSVGGSSLRMKDDSLNFLSPT